LWRRKITTKIKKIKKIKNLGTFNGFQWQNSCKEFEQYNFFYGWNYSGKTTLSRIFRCLEIKAQHPDFPNAEFSLETENDNITQRDISSDYPIRVFNEDFVKDNFKWDDENAKIDPVLIFGKKVRELEIKAKELKEKKEDKKRKLEENEKEIGHKKDELSNFLTGKASAIREVLGITNSREFDKNKLEDNIKRIKDIYQRCVLSSDEKENNLKIYRSKKKEKVTFMSPQLKLSTFISDVRDILAQKVTAQQIIEKLKANPKLSDWVRKGIDLHKKERICQFCGNPLRPERLKELNKHFSEEFNKLMNQIKEKGNEISDYIEEIKNLNFPDKARLFEDLQFEFENMLNSLNTIKSNYIQTLTLLKEELKRKGGKPFESIEMQELIDNSIKLSSILKEIELLIDTHNSKVDSFENEKQQAKEKLINHFAAEFIKNKNCFGIQEEIEKMAGNIENLRGKITQLGREIENINRQIKAEAIGANRINKYLRQFFNDNKLKIETTEDGKYKLYRNDQIAKDLSTGEKNIISLVYFFAKLEETDFDFNNAVIFIDDPVSSLDSNHVFRLYGFLTEKLKKCGQLFITTHNFDFFNLLKDSKFSLTNKEIKQRRKFYLIKKIKNQTGDFSLINNLPGVLLKHRSEYNYLFSILKSFNELDGESNFNLLYLLPNILRRFFEAYLFMRYPDKKEYKDKAKKFLKNTEFSDRESTLKLIDEYSHEKNPEHSQKFPDIEEVENAVSFILEAIKNKDEEHYEALRESLKNNSN